MHGSGMPTFWPTYLLLCSHEYGGPRCLGASIMAWQERKAKTNKGQPIVVRGTLQCSVSVRLTAGIGVSCRWG